MAVAIDLDPPLHIRHHGGVGGVGAVGGEAADGGFFRGDEEAGATALADAEQAEALRVGVRAVLEVLHRDLHVGDIFIRHPLERFVDGIHPDLV